MPTPIDVSEKETVLQHKSFVWITVNNLSVYVRHLDEGVVISVYPLNKENKDSLAETTVSFSEPEDKIIAESFEVEDE